MADDFQNTFFRRILYQDVDMVPVRVHTVYVVPILFTYIKHELLDIVPERTGKDLLPVLGHKNQMDIQPVLLCRLC